MSFEASDYPASGAPHHPGLVTGGVAGWPRLYVQHRAHGTIFEVARGEAAANLVSREYYCREMGHAWAALVQGALPPTHFVGRVHRPANPEITGRFVRGLRLPAPAPVAA